MVFVTVKDKLIQVSTVTKHSSFTRARVIKLISLCDESIHLISHHSRCMYVFLFIEIMKSTLFSNMFIPTVNRGVFKGAQTAGQMGLEERAGRDVMIR